MFTFGSSQKTLKTEEERYFYDLNSFIADVGGFFGLLFGLSVFDLFDLFCDAVIRLARFVTGKASI